MSNLHRSGPSARNVLLRRLGGAAILAGLVAPCALAQPGPSDGAWRGFYAGVGAGGSFGRAKWNALSTSDLPGTIVDASTPRTYDPDGVRGSLFGGYDWRSGRWMFGPVVDLGLTNARKIMAGFPGCTIDCAGAPGPGIDRTGVEFRWDASARARVGYLVTPGVLVFATGGFAWQNIRVSGLCHASLADPECLVAPGDPILSERHERTLHGATVGGGVEWRVSGPWRMLAEYRRVALHPGRQVFFVGEPSYDPGVSTYRFKIAPSADLVTVALVRPF